MLYLADMKQFILIIFCLLLGAISSYAQEESSIRDSTEKEFYLIKKNDGSEYIGEVMSDDGREVLIITKNIGKIYIPKADIASMTVLDEKKITITSDGAYQDYRLEGPYTTRYFFTTNALPIKKKENYMMLGLQGPEVHFAVSDNLSIGMMATWIGSPLALAAKYSFDGAQDAKIHYALGTIVATSGYLMQGQGVGGIHWLTATKGDRNSNISLSFGYAFAYTSDWFSDYNEKYEITSATNNRYNAAKELRTSYGLDIYQRLDDNKTRGSYVIGLAGITPVGKKSSFIFDILGFLGNKYEAVFDKNIIYPSVTYQGYNNQVVTEDITVTQYKMEKTGLRPHFIIMPAMRFNRSYDKAFQVALAGVITTQNNGDVIVFPVPTVSWLRQF